MQPSDYIDRLRRAIQREVESLNDLRNLRVEYVTLDLEDLISDTVREGGDFDGNPDISKTDITAVMQSLADLEAYMGKVHMANLMRVGKR